MVSRSAPPDPGAAATQAPNDHRPSEPPEGARGALLARVQAAIEDVRAGKMVILVDDEDRENEGDLTIASELVTPEAINFMAKYGRGLICLAMTPEQVDRLELPMMQAPGRRGPPLGTAFTVTIEAARGVTTGISAADRAHTIHTAVRPDAKPEDIVIPGHVLPLRARSGGVLVRAGQTEGSVDIARLAGLTPSGVICEIMNDDGTMARMPDLEAFATEHQLRVLSIADLITYRLQTEALVRRVEEAEVTLERTGTTWRAVVYQDTVDEQPLLALVKGRPSRSRAVLARMHHGSSLADTFGFPSPGRTSLAHAIDLIEAEGVGVVVYLPPSCDFEAELRTIRRAGELRGAQVGSEPDHVPQGTLREYGLGAQILRDLGVRHLRLLTNHPVRIVGLQGYGLDVIERVSV